MTPHSLQGTTMVRLFLALWLAITPTFAWAGSMTLLGVGGPAAASFSVTFNSTANSTAQTTTIDFGTMSYSSGNSRVIVGIIYVTNTSAATTVTAVTVGGVSLTQISGVAVNGGGSSNGMDAWISSAPLSGSSGDVQVTFNNTPNAFGSGSSVGVYSLVTTTPTPANSATATPNFVSSISLPSFTVPTGGGGIILTSAASATAFSSFTNGALDATATRNQIYGHITATGTPTLTSAYGGSDELFISAVSWGP